MVNRIKELAVKAGANWNHGDFNMGSSVEFQEDDLEKFAELFVKECAKVCKSLQKSAIVVLAIVTITRVGCTSSATSKNILELNGE